MRRVIPLRRRPVDIALWAFFAINLVFVSYMIDTEQLVIADPRSFQYPLWPPAFIIDAVHWWGFRYDPALIAREPWWRATIWIDQIFFGPFYAVALFAYAKGKEWIRIPSIIWGSVMITNVTVILFEEVAGRHATDHLGVVVAANASWIVFPVLVIERMWVAGEHPFTEDASEAGAPVSGQKGAP